MTYLDCDIGVCACGVERRLYRPEGEERVMCLPCVASYTFTRKEPRSVDVTTAKKREGMRARRESLKKRGLCVDCARLPALRDVVRCMKCHNKMLGNKRTA